MYEQYFRDITPIGCLCDVLIKDKKADGSRILMDEEPAFLIINKHSKDQFVVTPKKNKKKMFEKNELVATLQVVKICSESTWPVSRASCEKSGNQRVGVSAHVAGGRGVRRECRERLTPNRSCEIFEISETELRTSEL